MNIVSIVAKTNTGELFDIPVSDLSKYTGTLSIGDGYLPKLSAGKFVASSVIEDKNGQIFFKNYKNDKSYIGTPVALLGYDINGGITPVPLVNRSQSVNTVTTSQSFVFNGTPLTIPIFSSDGSGLEDSDFKKFGNGNYSLGGTNPFFKFDVDKGSINIAQQTTNDAFRINNKIVVTVDQSNNEITIGNTIYHTANIQHIKTDSIQFNTSATGVTGGVGVLTWNDTDGTLEFGMKGGNVTQQIGQELPVLVKHADNSGLTNGSVVYIVGSDGNHKTVRLAKADSEATSSNTFGIMTESATGGNKAFCTTFGLVRDINTSSLTEGSAVYLSPSVAGGITSTKPTAPNHIVLIGFCVRSHSVNGSIFVNINNGYELDELHDVLIGTKTNKDLLSYESVSGLWKNKTFADLGLATVDAFWSISGNNIATTGIIGSTTAQDVEFKANNQNRFTMYANAGLAIHSDTTFEDIVTLESSVNMSALTASQILALDASKNIQSLSTVTYPSLTELSYIKGLTSSAQTQINSKEPTITAGTTSQYWRGDKSWQTLDKSAVGLGNVDNTTDLLKPISTATQAALDLKANLASPTFTGTVVLPSTTSIGTVSSTEIGYLDGVTSSIQSQINGKFATPIGLSTNYITKWNGTTLADSVLYSTSAGFAIGTTTLDFYSQGGTGYYITLKSDASRLTLVSAGTTAAMIGGGNETIRRGAIWFSDGSNIDFYTNSSNSGTTATNKLRINASGSVGIGTTSLTGRSLSITKDITGAVTSYAVLNNGTIKSDVTTSVRLFQTSLTTEAATFTIPTIYHFIALQNSIGAGSSITSQIGFYVDASLVGAANNYGFRSLIAAGTNRWNNYHDGTAQNYFAGNTGIGSGRSVPITALDVNGQVSVSLGFASAPAYTFFGDLNNGWFSPTADTQAWTVGGSEVMRLSSAGSLGIGTTSLTGINLAIAKNITGNTVGYGIDINSVAQTDVTNTARYIRTLVSNASGGSMTDITHIYLGQGTLNSVTNQTGFWITSTLTGATNNYGIRNQVASGTGRWGLYFDGSVQNYIRGNVGIGSGSTVPATELEVRGAISTSLGSTSAPAYTFVGDTNNGWYSPVADTQAWSVGGSEVMRLSAAGALGLGTTSLTGRSLSVSKDITGAVTSYAVLNNGTIKSDVTTSVRLFQTSLTTEAATFTIPTIYHFIALQNSIGAGSSITSQIGFYVDASLVGAANNYGFRGQIPSGTNRWNLYMDGTGQNYLAGNLGLGITVATEQLHINAASNGGILLASGNAIKGVETSSGNKVQLMWWGGSDLVFGRSTESGAITNYFWRTGNANATRMTLNSTGLGIHNTSPSYGLDVTGTGHFTGAVTFDTVPSSLQDATSANHLVRYSQWISTTTVKYLPTAVKTVSLSNITLSGTQTVSGVALIAGDRILVAGQTTQSENGIYVVAAGAWSRATDSDTDTELRGFIVSVSNGTYGGYKYINTNQSTITVGTTAVTYAEFSNLSEIDPVFIAWRDLSRTANTVLATPNGSAGAASFRSLVTADISNLNSYSSFSNYTSTTDLNTLLSGKSDTSHTHSFNSLTSIPTTVAGYGLTINTSDITGLSSYTGFSGYTTTTALNTLLSGYSTTSHTHAFSEITSTPTTATGYGIVLVSSDIPSLDWSKITTGKPTTLSGYGITDAQSVLNGTGYVKMSGTTLSYINKEFVDTTTDQTIYGQKIFRDSFKVGNSLFNIQTGQPDTVDNDLKFDFITDATSFNYSISDIDDNIGTLFSIQGNFVGTNIRTDISTDLYIYRIVDSNLSTGTNKQILRTDSSGILNWTTIDGSYISNWATKQDALNGTGFVKANGTTITYDNSTYLSTSVAATTYQPLDADLTSISALTGDGVLRKVSNVWNLDTDMYLTTDTKIYFIATATQVGLVNPGTTLTVNGLGNLNLKSGIVTTGTYRSVTVDTYGRVTAGTNPTTVVGYGLTDVWTKTESDARYLLQSSYNPTWGQLTGSPIDNTAFNSTMLGYVNTSTTQTGIAGSKTFTSAMYANGTLTTNQLFVKDTTGGNAYPLSIVNALTYNGWSGSSLIKSGLDIYNDYKPLVFLGSHFMMLRGSLKLGGNSVGATGTVDFATERLDITGNIRYSGTLKPSNIAGTGWLYSNGTNDSWKLITPSDIFELSSFTGFDSRYYTKTEISDIIASTIPNGTSGHFLTHNSDGDLVFMNIDIDPVRLSSNKIAVGSPQGILTEVSGFEFVDKRYLSISKKTNLSQKINIGHYVGDSNALIEVIGGRLDLNSNVGLRINNLAGSTTRMMVVDSLGNVSAQAIPSGGSGSNYLPYRRVPYGSAENTQTSDDSLRFYSSVLESELKLGISTPLSFKSDNTGYNNYIQSIGGYINMSSNRISLLVSASGQPNSGEIELSSYHNTLIHSGYGDVIINATEGDVIIKGGAVEWVTTTINGQTRQILCKKL